MICRIRLLVSVTFLFGSHSTRSASVPGAMVPLRGYSPNNFAGLAATSRTNAQASMRPLETASLNMMGRRAASPGTPFGMSRKGACVPFTRLPTDVS